MKIFALTITLLAFCIPPIFAENAPLENLELNDAYQLALKRSETVAIQAEIIKQAEGHFYQSLSGVLPQIDFVDTELHQDVSKSSSSHRYAPERAFTFSQPLFSGFKEFASIAASKSERKERREELIRAKQLLFVDVSDAFYLFKSYQEDLASLTEIKRSYQERVDELKRRESLGRSRTSEVASTEAQYYKNEATIETVSSQVDTARQLLEFLVGQPVNSVASKDVVLDNLQTKDEYVSRALNRPDVLAAQHAAALAQREVTIARAGYWPTVNVQGASYVKRVGSDRGNNWDLSLVVRVPLFDGLQTFGDVKTAQSVYQQAKLRLSLIQRQATLDAQNAFTAVVSDKKQTEALAKALDASERNYQMQREDYSHNLVNNLEVLQALEDLETMRRNFISTKNLSQRAYWNLKVSTGDLNDSL